MKKITLLLIGILLISLSITSSFSIENEIQSNANKSNTEKITEIENITKNLSLQIEILKKDETNYRIEKDLLKEAYSSNLQSINLVITIVLGVIGVLGYLGIRSITQIKNDFQNELTDIKKLKDRFEGKLKDLNKKQSAFADKMSFIENTNKQQDKRLEVLEIIEKSTSYLNSRNWDWALKYINIGLEHDPKNEILLMYKSASLSAKGEMTDAIKVAKETLGLFPNNHFNLFNLLEYLAIAGEADEFSSYYTKYKNETDVAYNGNLVHYLQAIKDIANNDFTLAINNLRSFASMLDKNTKLALNGWSFDQVLSTVNRLNTESKKNLVISIVQFFNNNLTVSEFLNALDSIQASQVNA